MNRAPLRILITGSNGFLGSRLYKALSLRGHQVIGIDRSENESSISLNILDKQALQQFNQKQDPFDCVVHLAALLPGKTSYEEMMAVNVEASRQVWSIFCKEKTHGIFLSTGLVYGPDCRMASENTPLNPIGDYPQSKVLAEKEFLEIAQSTGSLATILRPSVLYGFQGSGSMFIQSILTALQHDQNFPMTLGAQWRDFLHVDDAVQALLLVIEQRVEGTFNLSSGEVLSIADLADLIAQITGKGHLIHKGSLPYREGESFHYSLNHSKITNSTGWKAQIPLAQGLESLWQLIQKKYGEQK